MCNEQDTDEEVEAPVIPGHRWVKDEDGLLYCDVCELPHAHWSGEGCLQDDDIDLADILTADALLEKREKFAAQAMQGMLANFGWVHKGKLIADKAIEYADALLEALYPEFFAEEDDDG